MFASMHIPIQELQIRWQRCRRLLIELMPDASGLLLFSRINLYYMTGTLANGLFWLPREGDSVLLCRRGLERARLESAAPIMDAYTSFKDVEALLQDAGSPLGDTLAVDMDGLSWALGCSLTKYVGAGRSLMPGAKVIARCRSFKTDWERERMRQAGACHQQCLDVLLPPLLKPGMSELDVAHTLWRLFFEHGSQGLMRMNAFGEEVFLGHIAMGRNGNYPSVFNGPLGLRGVHPAAPCMGAADTRWQPGVPLSVDTCFCLDGYHTDATRIYWPGLPETIPTMVRDAHAFCLELENWLAAQMKPGAVPTDLWRHCIERAEKAGWAEGFMGLTPNKVVFSGHGIGLAIDEQPVLAQGCDTPLEKGMTLAIEPKIGLPGIGMVGSENTYEITANGGISLTGCAREMVVVGVGH